MANIARGSGRSTSHRDWRFDGRVRVVADELEIFEFEIVDVLDGWIQFHPRQRSTITSELFARLLEMVLVKMQVAKGVNEIARPQIDNLRDH